MKLKEHELKNIIKITKKSRNTLYGICPKCKRNEFGISLTKENHPFGCFRKKNCGFSGNIYTLLKFLNIQTISKETYNGLTIEEVLEEENGIKFEILKEIKMPIGFRDLFKTNNVSLFEYLINRGYKDEDFINYKVGHTTLQIEHKGRLLIGFIQNKRLVAFIGRSLKDSVTPKYLNSKTDFSKLIDGLYENQYSEATIVEGHFDRINTRNMYQELGIQNRVLCTFGAKISDYQIALMQSEGITEVNLFFDPDVLKVVKATINNIGNRFFKVNIMTLENKEIDPGDASKNEILKSYKSRENFVKFTATSLPNLI